MAEKHSIHESNALLMSAEDVFEDAARIAAMLDCEEIPSESVVQLNIPLSSFLNALDHLSRNEFVMLYKHIEERLAV